MATVSEASPIKPKKKMAKIFNSNEILEMCDMHVSENGKMVVATKSFHSAELERLGTPEKVIRGRFKLKDRTFIFDPYAEQSRKPTYSKQVHVGSCTTLAVTADKFKISMVMGRHMGQARTIDFIRAEMDDILHQLEGELYDTLVRGQQTTDKVCANRTQNQACLNYAEVQPKLNNEVVNRQQTEGGAA